MHREKSRVPFLRYLIYSIAAFFVLLIVMSFTTQPFWIYHWLGTSQSEMDEIPECIIVMGGSGMPSEEGLMRSYTSAQLAQQLPDAQIVIALPGDTLDSLSSVCLMKQELILRGIVAERISFESIGTNTRGQALELIQKNPGLQDKQVAIVSSPEHMLRSILTFRKAGFEKVGGIPAFQQALEVDFSYDDKKLGGRNEFFPHLGNNTQLRYQFWNHMKYEILIIREFTALAFYKLKGWV